MNRLLHSLGTTCLSSSLLLTLLLSSAMAASTGPSRFTARGSAGSEAILELDQAPLLAMRPTRFQLRTTPPLPLAANERVRCDLTMPAMPMPPNRPLVAPQGDHFSGELVFTMAGAWQAEFIAPLSDGRTERFVFTLPEVLLR